MKTLLLVDDSRTFQRVLERILSPHFKIVGNGYSGIEGFELYQKLKPDIVFMDITMPNCSGKECLQKIISFDPQAKVVMVSSLSDTETVKECLDLGAKSFINKENVISTELTDNTVLKTANLVVNQTPTTSASSTVAQSSVKVAA